jgi:uncharacterized membrane protein (UPF0127 family)
MFSAAALASTPAADFQPEQLRGFARSQLTVQRRTGRDLLHIWVAQTPEQHQQGLMWIQNLPPDYGMLFVLDAPRSMTMWMKNTFVPLDMLFFDPTGRITHIVERAEPQSLRLISSNGEVAGVVEILAGEAQRRDIRVGDRLVHPLLGGR